MVACPEDVANSVLSIPKYCMILGGIWTLALPTQNRILNAIYKVYSMLVKIYLPTFLVSMYIRFGLTMTTEFSKKNPQDLFKYFGYVVSLSIAVFAAILCQRTKVVQFITYVQEEEQKIGETDDPDIHQCYSETLKFCRKFNIAVIAFMSNAAVGMTSENLTARFEIDKYNRQHNESMEKPFFYELYYFNLDKEKHSLFLLVMNCLFVLINSSVVASTRMLFMTSIIFISSALSILQIKFEKSMNQQEKALEITKMLVVEHQDVIRATKNLNECIKYLIFMEYLLNSLTLATLAIIPLLTSKRSMSPVLAFGVIFTLIMVLGYSANEIQIQSSSLADALYECRWYEQNETTKKMLFTMLIRAQKPLGLTIGPFAMTIDSSLKIIKTSYSYKIYLSSQDLPLY
ncbi:odorant receptor 49b-like [Cylas formicarius]|uniref:odorant receptor 49b-like n=1 Tax=Cylas formicarius TaxID=197179 RepID=UPI00295889C7|nr:odorant receptor 49b-like [Cylas formicarius]